MKINEILSEASGVLGAIGKGLGNALAPNVMKDLDRQKHDRAQHASSDTNYESRLLNTVEEIMKNWRLEYKKDPPKSLGKFRSDLNNYLRGQNLMTATIPRGFAISNPPEFLKTDKVDANGNYIVPLKLESGHRADVEKYIASVLLYTQQQTRLKSKTPTSNISPKQSSAMDMNKLSQIQIIGHVPPTIRFNNINFVNTNGSWHRADAADKKPVSKEVQTRFNQAYQAAVRTPLLTTPDGVEFLNFNPVEIRYKNRRYYQGKNANWNTVDPNDSSRFNVPQDFFDKQLDVAHTMQRQSQKTKKNKSTTIVNPTVTP